MRMKDRNKNKKNGFTLVELIVVIVIILVLAAVLVPTVLKYINKAKEAAAIEECAGVVRAAANERTEWLAEGGTEPSKTDIVAAAGAGGKVIKVDYSPDDYDVTYMEYESSNGLTVYFEREHDPQYWIKGKEGSSPTSVVSDWITKANDTLAKLPGNNMADTEVINKLREENGGELLAVDQSFLKGTRYTVDDDLRWFTHSIGSKAQKDYSTILFANKDTFVGEDPKGNDHAGWIAKLVYVNGKVYQSDNEAGANISKINDSHINDPEKVGEWLLENGFTEVQK